MRRSLATLSLLPLLAAPLFAMAASPPPPGSDSQPVRSVKRGTDAAGRGIEHADDATRRGIAKGSARATAAPRRWGESLGRKLGGGSRPAPPPVGPQGKMP